jgi:Protein of unknown function (DUF3168)
MTVTQPIEALEAALYAVLNVSAVKTTAGATGGVWANLAAQGTALPYVIIQWQGGGDENDHSHDSVNIIYTVKALAASAQTAAIILAACDALLHKQTLSVTGWTNFWLRREEWVSYAEVDQLGKLTYHRGAMYRIRNERTT